MSNPLDVTCPHCQARPGERCMVAGAPGPTHRVRREARPRERDRRPYDVEPLPIPEFHQQPPPPESEPVYVEGRVTHALSNHTRNVGLAGIDAARAALAKHRHHGPPPAPDSEP